MDGEDLIGEGLTQADGACGKPECGRCRHDLQLLETRHERLAKAMASAAHDFSSPLSALSGYISLLQKGKLAPVNEAQRLMLDEMQSCCDHLKNLAQDFLLFSGFETGGIGLRFERKNFRDCVAEICDMWLPRFRDRGIAFRTELPESGREFLFDWHRMQRVLSNLLGNAWNYTPAGGSVGVKMEELFWEMRSSSRSAEAEMQGRSANEPNAVRVSVSDTGPGIPAEYHLDIFEDFFRLATEREGVGLGLSIARRLVTGHGGRIWVESKPGEGSTFLFTLPFKPPESEHASATRPAK